MSTPNADPTDSLRLEHARVLARLVRRALDDDGVRVVAEQLMLRMDTMDPDSDSFARCAACVVELGTAPPSASAPISSSTPARSDPRVTGLSVTTGAELPRRSGRGASVGS